MTHLLGDGVDSSNHLCRIKGLAFALAQALLDVDDE
jgi:hypothetical protein